MKNLTLTIGLLISIFLSGCFLKNETAGTEDFPNTIQASLSNGLASDTGWNNLESVNTDVPTPTVSSSTEAQGTTAKIYKAAKRGLSKKRAPVADTNWTEDSSSVVVNGDTTTVKLYLSNNVLSQRAITVLTLVISGEDSLFILATHDTYRMLGNIHLSSTLHQDADGDGIINGIEGQVNRASVTTETYHGLSTTITHTVTDAGPDADFGEDQNDATRDNILVSLSNDSISFNGDTLSHESIRDDDGDGLVGPVDGSENKVILTIWSVGLFGVVTTHVIKTDAGPDGDFGDNDNEATRDNRIYTFMASQVNSAGDSVSITEARDLDGDGIISAVPGNDKNEALFYQKTWFLKISVTVEEVGVNAGKDGDFDTEVDNQILFFKKTVMDNNLDTLSFAEVMDADGDGIAFDTLSDSSVVLMHAFHTLLLERAETWTTIVIFPADSNKNYPIKMVNHTHVIGGISSITRITGTGQDSTIDINDTVYVFKENIYDGPNAILDDSFTFKFGLGDDLYSDDDNEMYSFGFVRDYKNDKSNGGAESYVSFTFVSDEPVLANNEPESGYVEIFIQLQNGKEHSFTGHIDSEYIEGTYTKPDGTEVTGKWPAGESDGLEFTQP